MNNYIEKLKFTVELENLTEYYQQHPVLLAGLNEISSENTFCLQPGYNKIVFSDVVYFEGDQQLIIKVKEGKNAWNIGSFLIKDIKIHGLSVGLSLFNCEYFPNYDKEYFEKNPNSPGHIKSGTHVGNRGTWIWYFQSPVYNNALYKIGLW